MRLNVIPRLTFSVYVSAHSDVIWTPLVNLSLWTTFLVSSQAILCATCWFGPLCRSGAEKSPLTTSNLQNLSHLQHLNMHCWHNHAARLRSKKMETTSQIVVNQKSNDFEEEEPLVDKTEALVLHSRRTERQRKKQQKKTKVLPFEARGLLDLPYELILEILALLEPSDIFIISRTNKSLAQFIASEELPIANSIIKCRYSCLSQCFRPPALMKDIGPTYIEALQYRAR